MSNAPKRWRPEIYPDPDPTVDEAIAYLRKLGAHTGFDAAADALDGCWFWSFVNEQRSKDA